MSRETTIYTIRHAHTAYNEQKRYAGTIDVPLNERGMSDINQIKHLMDAYHFDVVITSTMKRTIETAELMFENRYKVAHTELCNERCFGSIEGMTWDEIQHLEPPILFINVGNDLHSVNPQGSEPFEDVWNRAKTFKRFLFDHYRGGSILVISHGVFLQMFHGLLRGISCIESLAYYPGNLELNMFQWGDYNLRDHKVFHLLEQADTRNGDF